MVKKTPERHSRTEMLLGDGTIDVLTATRVAIFGIGGVGGYALEALVRCGIGEIDVIDADNVSESNINRQILATSDNIGQRKVDAAIERCKSIDPNVKINPVYAFYSPENADEFDLTKYDYIIDAIDTVASKCELISRANAIGVPIVSSMGTGGKLDPTALEVADINKTSVCPLARAVRTELRKKGIKKLKVVYSKEEPIKRTVIDTHGGQTVHRAPGSVIFVPATAGLILAELVVCELISKAHGKEEAE